MMARLAGWDGVTSVGEPVLAEAVQLHANSPNPFTERTLIRFTLPFRSKVTLRVFDAAGRSVATLLENADFPSGPGSIGFVGSTLPAGLYMSELTAGGQRTRRALLLLR